MNLIDEETGLDVKSEDFELLAFRGDDIDRRESWAFHVQRGEKIKAAMQMLEEEGMADYLIEHRKLDIDNTPNHEGQLKKVTGTLIDSECGLVTKMINVKWVMI